MKHGNVLGPRVKAQNCGVVERCMSTLAAAMGSGAAAKTESKSCDSAAAKGVAPVQAVGMKLGARKQRLAQAQHRWNYGQYHWPVKDRCHNDERWSLIVN